MAKLDREKRMALIHWLAKYDDATDRGERPLISEAIDEIEEVLNAEKVG